MSDSILTPTGTLLPEGWALRPLGEMCSKIGSGSTPRGGAAAYVPEGKSFIRSQNVLDHKFSEAGLAFINDDASNRLSGVQVQERDVLLNITGDGETIARCCVAPKNILPARVNQHVMILRTKGDLLPEFLQPYLSHPKMRAYMLSYSSGGSRRALTKGQIEKFLIALPPLAEQRSIATLLMALRDKIAVNEKIATTAGNLCVEIFSEKSWAGRTKIDSISNLHKEQVTPSAMGSQVVAHYSIPAYDAGNVPDLTTAETIKSAKFLVRGPAVLLSKLNPEIPRIWNTSPEPSLPAIASTEFLVLEPKSGVTTAELWAALSQPGIIASLATKATGTSKSHQRVRPAEVMATEVADPRELGEVRARVNSLAIRAAQAREESRTLAALRDTLLPQLMSGKLRVRDAERIVENAV